MSDTLLATVREQINKKHRDAIQALETIKTYLVSTDIPEADEPTHTQPVVNRGSTEKYGSRVSLVLNAIGREFKTVEKISDELGLPEAVVRAVLYSKAVKPKVYKRKINKKLAFKGRPIRIPVRNKIEGESVAGLVKNLIDASPNGIATATITSQLNGQLEKIGGTRAAIGAALHNLKKRTRIRHDEEAGLYFPVV
jgi:hypothetical protein